MLIDSLVDFPEFQNLSNLHVECLFRLAPNGERKLLPSTGLSKSVFNSNEVLYFLVDSDDFWCKSNTSITFGKSRVFVETLLKLPNKTNLLEIYINSIKYAGSLLFKNYATSNFHLLFIHSSSRIIDVKRAYSSSSFEEMKSKNAAESLSFSSEFRSDVTVRFLEEAVFRLIKLKVRKPGNWRKISNYQWEEVYNREEFQKHMTLLSEFVEYISEKLNS